jgi:DNA-binding helix-turn-helix protein
MKNLNYQKIKEKREEKGYSTRKLAEILGVSHNLVNCWENQSIRSMKPEIEKKVLETLGMKKKELYIELKKEDFKTNFGDYLKFLRKSKGLTASEFAEKIGKATTTVSKWENGIISNIKDKDMEKICAFYQITPYELYLKRSVQVEGLEEIVIVTDRECNYEIDDLISYGKKRMKIKSIKSAGINENGELYIKLLAYAVN